MKMQRTLGNFTKLLLFIAFIYCISTGLIIFSKIKFRETVSLSLTEKDLYHKKSNNVKYILQWTLKTKAPFIFMEQKDSAFIKNNCKFRNCYVTDDKNYFLDQTDFDALAFNGRDVVDLWQFEMPEKRSIKQKYIFATMESANRFPVCNENLEDFFNWTWTYKLDSDMSWEYFHIFDLNYTKVGPKIDMIWPANMKPINKLLKTKLSRKRKAVAWFVSNCYTNSRRETFVTELSRRLKRFGRRIDIYGSCGKLSCPRNNSRSCSKMIEDHYLFYLSFENSFAEDYVTEKVLNAINNYAVPIVYGGANYSRYLPDGSYLNALALGPERLAQDINDIILNKTRYYDFFRWRNYFVYKRAERHGVCTLCEMLNNEEKVAEAKVWNRFRTWWNGASYKDNC